MFDETCFVHAGFECGPPHESDSPEEAVRYAARRLEVTEGGDGVRWRRDELYPHNFLPFNVTGVADYLRTNGEVVLQLVDGSGCPVKGQVAHIFTAEEEARNNDEAESALLVPDHQCSRRK